MAPRRVSMGRSVARPMISNQNLSVSWKSENPQDSVWKNLYRITMRTTVHEKQTNHYNIFIWCTKFILVPQAMKIPAAQAAVDKETGKDFGMGPDKDQKKIRGDRRSKDVGRKSSFRITDGHMSFEKCWIGGKAPWIQRSSCTPRWYCKDDSGSYAVFTEQGSSASQTTAAKIMDIISRLPGCEGQAADTVSAYTQVKMEDAHKLLKIPKSECPDIWIRLPRHKWPKSWSSMEDPVVPLERNFVWSSFGRTFMGKAIWENPIKTWLGKIPSWECLFVHREKRIILICVCGWHKIGWKETKSWSTVERTQQRSRFGRTNIFPGSCILGMHSTSMRNKQRYCGQLQNHVRIANFCGWIREITISSKYSYFIMVLWYGWSCKEMCGTILWVGQQVDRTTLQSIYSMHRWPPLQRRRNKICWKSQVCSQIVLKWLYLARIERPDILWSVNKLARSITKWTKACDKRLNRLISYIHHTCACGQYCHVGNTAKQCRLGLFQDSDFAGDLEDSKSTSGRTLCILGSDTFVPISWMCKKQTSVSHSSTESEIISLDAGLRLDGIFALDLWDLIVLVLGNTIQTHDRSAQPVVTDKNQRS